MLGENTKQNKHLCLGNPQGKVITTSKAMRERQGYSFSSSFWRILTPGLSHSSSKSRGSAPIPGAVHFPKDEDWEFCLNCGCFGGIVAILLHRLFRRVTHLRVKRRELCKLFLIQKMNENRAERQEEQRSPQFPFLLSLTVALQSLCKTYSRPTCVGV